MKNIALVSALALLAGCATAERVGGPTAGPGHADYSIACPAGQLHLCFARAREVCPKGYDVVSLNRLNSGEYPLLPGTMILRDHVVVRCET